MIDRLLDAGDGLRRRILGPPDQLVRRLLMIALVGSVAIAIGGVLLAIKFDFETGRSSLPYIQPALEITTSVWFYLLVLAYLLRSFLTYRDRRYATQAAEITGYSVDSIRREKYEASTTDGATRVLVSDEDDRDEIVDRIDRALETGEDDEIELNPEAFEVAPDERDKEDGRLERPGIDHREIARSVGVTVWDAWNWSSIPILAALVLSGSYYVLAEIAAPAITGAAPSTSTGLYVALAASGFLGISIRKLWRDRDQIREFIDRVRAKHDVDQEPHRAEDADDLLPVPREDAFRDPWLEQFKLARLDLQTTLDFDELLWYVAVPAIATIGLLLLVVQIWVPLWFYPAIVATGLLVGLLNYARIGLVRSRRLEGLRQESESIEFGELSLLVKEVEIPERTTYHAHLLGRQYAHDDREEFCEEVAHRAYEEVNGIPVSPSVLEKQARQLETSKPVLHGFRDAERERIMRWLVDRVRSEEHGLIAKAKLIEDCVEHDRKERGIGPFSRTKGKGYDPDLVRECYRELVPAALVEEEIELVDQDETVSLTAVRLRTDPLPPEFAEIRAQFSSQFGNYARTEPLYDLPDVSDRLEEEPIYSGRVGAGGSA